jgi:hypothetical protein
VGNQARDLASLAGARGAYVDSVGHLTASRILHRESAKQNFPPTAMSWDVVGYSRIRTVHVESGRVHECGVIVAANVGYYIVSACMPEASAAVARSRGATPRLFGPLGIPIR